MASSAQRDTTQFHRRTGRPPIVLARLPRLGEPARLEEPARHAEPAPVPPAANELPVAPSPDSIPQLELRDQIDQRIRLHTAGASIEDARSTEHFAHFADHQHAIDRGPVGRRDEHRLQRQRELDGSEPLRVPAPKLHSPDSSQATLSERLFELHAKLAPHAGLIVALALIASAGLLYWMIVGPTPLSTPTYDNFAPQFHDEGIGAATEYVPDFSTDFSAGVSQPTDFVAADDQWMEVALPEPTPLVAEEMTSQEITAGEMASDELTAEPAAGESLPSNEKLSYPSTGHANFDFSKMGIGPRTANAPSALPAVSGPDIAGRPSSTTTR